MTVRVVARDEAVHLAAPFFYQCVSGDCYEFGLWSARRTAEQGGASSLTDVSGLAPPFFTGPFSYLSQTTYAALHRGTFLIFEHDSMDAGSGCP